ncbi:hypothetical protein N7501_010645, partial [Penicillium viridicatum]
ECVYLRLARGAEPGYILPSHDITRKITQRQVKCRVLERSWLVPIRIVVSVQHLERASIEGEMSSAEPPSTFDPDVDAVLDVLPVCYGIRPLAPSFLFRNTLPTRAATTRPDPYIEMPNQNRKSLPYKEASKRPAKRT